LSREVADAKWNKIYQVFGVSGEQGRAEVKLALYAYFAVNGTSKCGDYGQTIITSGGATCLASDVVNIIGKDVLRRFFRAYADEPYWALKGSNVLESDGVAVAKAAERNIPSNMVYLLADYLSDCPAMTPSEAAVYARAFSYNIKRAGAARGGRDTASVDASARDEVLEAQRAAGQESVSNAMYYSLHVVSYVLRP